MLTRNLVKAFQARQLIACTAGTFRYESALNPFAAAEGESQGQQLVFHFEFNFLEANYGSAVFELWISFAVKELLAIKPQLNCMK